MRIDSPIRLFWNGIWPGVRRELARLRTDAEREYAIRYLHKKLVTEVSDRFFKRLGVFVLLPIALIAAVIHFFFEQEFFAWMSGIPFPSWSIWLFLGCIYSSFLLKPARAWWIRRKAHRLLRRHLNQMGIAVCMDCGYDLRNLLSERCPECGCARFTGEMSHSGLRE